MKAKPKKIAEPSRQEFETFHTFGNYEISQMKEATASCWNGLVSFRKMRVTIEQIDEPKDVLAERLLSLWRKCDNHHHYGPLTAAAKSIGLELPSDELGIERKRP